MAIKPNFLTSMGYHIFLSMVLRARAELRYKKILTSKILKDGAYYCYCAYVLRISRYSGFLSVMLTNTGIFLRGLKLSEKVDLSKCPSFPKRKLGVTMHF